MGANHQIHRAALECSQRARALPSGARSARSFPMRTGQAAKRSRKVLSAARASSVVRHQQRHLAPAHERDRTRRAAPLRLAKAHIAADQPIHRPRRQQSAITAWMPRSGRGFFKTKTAGKRS